MISRHGVLVSLVLSIGSIVLTANSNVGLKVLRRTLTVADDRLGIIHLGKCHGIGLKNTINAHGGSTLFQRGFEWYHMMKPELDKHKDFIGLVRDPVDRVVSSFLFEHPKNAPYRKNPMHLTLPHKEKLEMYDCFDTFDELVTKGLGDGEQNGTDEGYSLYRWNAQRCTFLARKLLRNYVSLPGLTHFVFKYDFYYQELLDQLGDSQTLYLIRTEKMLEDLNNIEALLGGKSRDSFKSIAKTSHYKPGVHSKDLPAKEKHISPEGMKNLCLMICGEIQIYKKLFLKAANLNEADQKWMIESLRQKCPVEADTDMCPPQRF